MPTLLPNMTPEQRLLAAMMEQGALEKIGEQHPELFYDFMDLHTPCNDLLGSMQAKLLGRTSAWSQNKETHDSLTPLCQELELMQDRLNEIVDTMAEVLGIA